MSIYLKAYWIWTAAYVVAIVWLLAFTDLRLNWWQVALLVLAVNVYGASQRNFERHEHSRKSTPAPRTSYLPGDEVGIMLPKGDICNQSHNGKGVVTYGPDNEGGWIVSSAPGSLRCVASELAMITPREER